jgi:uncharacterized OB-fold protein
MIDTFETLKVPGPIPTTVSMPFWQAARDRELHLQHCDTCNKWIFYPRVICPHCWSDTLSWRAASGCGHLQSFTEIHRPGHPGWQPAAPYTLGLVRLVEGPTMLSLVAAPFPSRLTVGMPLRVMFVPIGDFVLPVFKGEEDYRVT